MRDLKVYIYGYNPSSRSARALAKSLDIPLIRHENSRFQPRLSKTVINWGSSRIPEHVMGTKLINTPENVHATVNKLTFFEKMSDGDGPRLPEWTTDPEEVLDWIEDGKTVIARTDLTGHSGSGMVFIDKKNVGNHLDAPLYTVYKPKKEEFRVHVFNGEVIDVQQKLLRKEDDLGNPIDPAKVDFRVRNLANGFIFGRNNINPNKDVLDQSVLAYRKSDLVFGAVDVIWNEKEGRAYVLEINSAPGLEGTTIGSYTKAFRDLFSGASATGGSRNV